MAVILRLARFGRKNRPFYRIVATDKANRRDGRFIEVVGTYNTLTSPPDVTLQEDKVKKWISHGAKLSTVVRSVVVKRIPGLVEGLETSQKKKIQDARKKRKARAQKAGRTKTKKESKKAK